MSAMKWKCTAREKNMLYKNESGVKGRPGSKPDGRKTTLTTCCKECVTENKISPTPERNEQFLWSEKYEK